MEVPEDLIEEFLLHLPPADPANLVGAALVCKPWCRLISSPRFRRRYRQFHRTPPMLGFLANTTKGPRFVSTSSFSPPGLDEYGGWQVLDVRQGRVLLRSTDMEFGSPRLTVWVPVTNEWRELPLLSLSATNWNAAVLCAASGSYDCDHLDCQCGQPFLVVLVANVAATVQSMLTVYSSESGAWSEPRPLPICYVIKVAPTALVGTTLYFLVYWSSRILGYDLATGETFVFTLPPGSGGDRVLRTTEDGGLGVALEDIRVRYSREGVRVSVRLSLWSMETGPDGDIGWAQIRIIEKRLPVKAWSVYPGHVGFAPGLLFFNTVDGLFSINLISDQVKKELANNEIWVTKVVPYMSFYTPGPGLTITDKGQQLMLLVHEMKNSSFWSKDFKSSGMKCVLLLGNNTLCLVSVGSGGANTILNYYCIGGRLPIFHLC